MSLAGRARIHGTTVTIYRPVGGYTGDLGRKVASWTKVAERVHCLIDSESDELMQKVFGTPEGIRDRGWFPGLPDLKPGDGLVTTGGKRNGTKWRAADVRRFDQSSRSEHLEVALAATEEAIG